MIASLLLFLVVCGGLLVLPFLPAVLEWLRPSDRSPLPVPVGYCTQASHFANELRAQIKALVEDARTGKHDSLVVAEALHSPADWRATAVPVLIQEPLKASESLCCEQAVYAASDFQAAAGSSFSSIMCAGNLDVGSGSEITGWAHADHEFHLRASTVGLRRLSSGVEIQLDRSCCFERIHAPRIAFGAGCSDEPGAATEQRTPREWGTLAGAQRASEVLFRFGGNCEVPDASHLVGSIVVDGVLSVGPGSLIEGDVKAHKGVFLAAGAQVLGSVVSDGNIELLPSSRIDGPVVSEANVLLARGCRIGRPTQPTTITAPVIMVEVGAVAHGTIWARHWGVVWGLA